MQSLRPLPSPGKSVRFTGLARGDDSHALARLAASYLLAGDMETAMRYVNLARDRLPPVAD